MRPLRLLLSVLCTLLAFILVLSLAVPRHNPADGSSDPKYMTSSRQTGVMSALFSFTAPSSLFPPTAMISLTDDNSTFFLSRPAAFGPLLPKRGLSAQLWIGSGFGEDTIARGGLVAGAEGELGCSDVPGWGEASQGAISRAEDARSSTKHLHGSDASSSSRSNTRARRTDGRMKLSKRKSNDGTDDHLHHPLPDSSMSKSSDARLGGYFEPSGHADIQSLQEGAEISGKIVLLSRGGCGFLEKAKWAQRRGATALIVGDNVPGGPLLTMYASGDTSNVSIPSLFTSHTTAHLLSSLIPSSTSRNRVGVVKPAKAHQNGDRQKATTSAGGTRAKAVAGTTTRLAMHQSTSQPITKQGPKAGSIQSSEHKSKKQSGWLGSFFHLFGFGTSQRTDTRADSRRPPSSGHIDWVRVEDWHDDKHIFAQPTRTKTDKAAQATVNPSDDFVIGVHDWRDPDLLPQPRLAKGADNSLPGQQRKGGPGGETSARTTDTTRLVESDAKEDSKPSWLRNLHWSSDKNHHGHASHDQPHHEFTPTSSTAGDEFGHLMRDDNALGHDADTSSEDPTDHEGLWVTLTPTNTSSSPFFDTLLVLVVSPLVTLTIVYALLLLRSRIRRRRWRAPKSVVDRLPVRTYHTIPSDPSSSSSSLSSSSALSTPGDSAASATTPLLQHRPVSRASSRSQPCSQDTLEVAGQPSSYRSISRSSSPDSEKREAGLAEWRRRYGGKQRECVVCLEEYVDGVSQVMSLPCGHEFHAECITPWLVTRRRTCPICKGDVVRSLSRSGPSSVPSRNYQTDADPSNGTDNLDLYEDDDGIQRQAAELRNDSADANLPVPSDLEAGRYGNSDGLVDEHDNRLRTGSSGNGYGIVRDLALSGWSVVTRTTERTWNSFGLDTASRNRNPAVDRDR